MGWEVHVWGPDDVLPASSRFDAMVQAHQINAASLATIGNSNDDPMYPLAWATPRPAPVSSGEAGTGEAGARAEWFRLLETITQTLGCEILGWRDYTTGEWSATCETCGCSADEEGCMTAQHLATAVQAVVDPAPVVAPSAEEPAEDGA